MAGARQPVGAIRSPPTWCRPAICTAGCIFMPAKPHSIRSLPALPGNPSAPPKPAVASLLSFKQNGRHVDHCALQATVRRRM